MFRVKFLFPRITNKKGSLINNNNKLIKRYSPQRLLQNPKSGYIPIDGDRLNLFLFPTSLNHALYPILPGILIPRTGILSSKIPDGISHFAILTGDNKVGTLIEVTDSQIIPKVRIKKVDTQKVEVRVISYIENYDTIYEVIDVEQSVPHLMLDSFLDSCNLLTRVDDNFNSKWNIIKINYDLRNFNWIPDVICSILYGDSSDSSNKIRRNILEETSLVKRGYSVLKFLNKRIYECISTNKVSSCDKTVDTISFSIDRKMTDINILNILKERAFYAENINIKNYILSEVDRFISMEITNPEKSGLLQYLNVISKLPFRIKMINNLKETDYDNKSYDSMNSIEHVLKYLDATHMGLDNIKKRIIDMKSTEILSEWGNNNNTEYNKTDNKISNCVNSCVNGNRNRTFNFRSLLLVGPPGTGKSSIAESIARALNRPFDKISLGGMSDGSDLKGHKRAYLGSKMGRIVSSLIKLGTTKCVILLDEIDKTGCSSNIMSDPLSIILEILDETTNQFFIDSYIGPDIPLDLRDILFIATANGTSNLSSPLLDRLDLIKVNGYSLTEKFDICRKYLIPEIARKYGISDMVTWIPDHYLLNVIKNYSPEAGVRKLKSMLEITFRYLSTRMVKKMTEIRTQSFVDENKLEGGISDSIPIPIIPVTNSLLNININNGYWIRDQLESLDIKEVLGPREISREEQAKSLDCILGLGWTEQGGVLLSVQISLLSYPHTFSSNGNEGNERDTYKTFSIKRIKLNEENLMNHFLPLITGNVGTILRESINTIAAHFSAEMKPMCISIGPDLSDYKDGPSLGLAISAALMTILRKQNKLRFNDLFLGVAFMGSVSLGGEVISVGGTREKLICAVNSELKIIVAPLQMKDEINNILKDLAKSSMAQNNHVDVEMIYVDTLENLWSWIQRRIHTKS